jgi:hypothetical protein
MSNAQKQLNQNDLFASFSNMGVVVPNQKPKPTTKPKPKKNKKGGGGGKKGGGGGAAAAAAAPAPAPAAAAPAGAAAAAPAAAPAAAAGAAAAPAGAAAAPAAAADLEHPIPFLIEFNYAGAEPGKARLEWAFVNNNHFIPVFQTQQGAAVNSQFSMLHGNAPFAYSGVGAAAAAAVVILSSDPNDSAILSSKPATLSSSAKSARAPRAKEQKRRRAKRCQNPHHHGPLSREACEGATGGKKLWDSCPGVSVQFPAPLPMETYVRAPRTKKNRKDA